MTRTRTIHAVKFEPFFETIRVLTAFVDPASHKTHKYVDKTADPDSEYSYRVVKEGDGGDSPPSDQETGRCEC